MGALGRVLSALTENLLISFLGLEIRPPLPCHTLPLYQRTSFKTLLTHRLAIANKAAMNIRVHIYFRISVFIFFG